MSERRWVLLRHAPARSRDFTRWPDDQGRPLKGSGRKEFAEAARGLVRLLSSRGEVATSPLARALETAELLGAEWPQAQDPAVWKELLPDASLPALFVRAKRVPGDGDLLMVGHEPELSRFVGYCLTGEGTSVVRMARGGTAALEFPGGVRPGGGRLLWALTRSQLRKLGASSHEGSLDVPRRRSAGPQHGPSVRRSPPSPLRDGPPAFEPSA